MHATHEIDAKNFDAALDQEKLSWRLSSSREFHDGNGRREKFLKKHKDTMLFVKIKILIIIKIGTNSLKCFYFIIIILHSTSIGREL